MRVAVAVSAVLARKVGEAGAMANNHPIIPNNIARSKWLFGPFLNACNF